MTSPGPVSEDTSRSILPPGASTLAAPEANRWMVSAPGCSAVKGILEPVIHTFVRLRGEVGGIEDNEVKRPPDRIRQIAAHYIDYCLMGTKRCMRVDIGSTVLATFERPAAIMPEPVPTSSTRSPGLTSARAALRSRYRIGFRLVHLGGVVVHR